MNAVSILRKLALSAAAVAAPVAQADVLTFDDLTGVQGFFTTLYKGFQFGTLDIDTGAWFHTRIPSAFYSPKSGNRYVATDYTLYTEADFEATQPISSATDFAFDGAWFSGARQVKFELYLDGKRVHTSDSSVDLGVTPVFVASGYSGAVDAVVVLGTQGYYAMDDFTYHAAPVPEVGTGAMLALGLAGFGLFAARRKSRTA